MEVSGRLQSSAALSPVKNAGAHLVGGWVECEYCELGKFWKYNLKE